MISDAKYNGVMVTVITLAVIAILALAGGIHMTMLHPPAWDANSNKVQLIKDQGRIPPANLTTSY